MHDEDWQFPEGRFIAYILAAAENGGEPLFIAFNAAAEGIEVTLPAGTTWRTGRRCSTPRQFGAGRADHGSARRHVHHTRRVNHGFRGQVMTGAYRFGPIIGRNDATFRLWAPGAKNVTLLCDDQPAMDRSEDGWFTTTIPGVPPGTHKVPHR